MSRSFLKLASAVALVAAGLAHTQPVAAQEAPVVGINPEMGQPSTSKGDWTHYTADERGTKYMPLDQINADNFNSLEVAWTFNTNSLGPSPEFNLEGTPLAINGTIYAVGGGGGRRSVVALDGTTGELLWKHALDEGERAEVAPRRLSGRGVSYWTDGQGDQRILYVSIGYRLVELNAKTGELIPGFGDGGMVDLKKGVMIGNTENHEQRNIDLVGGEGEIGLHATPTVADDIVIVGSSMLEGLNYRAKTNAKGLVRAFDVRTGKQLWRFDTMPGPGEFGHDTWEGDSWYYTGNVGVWTQITVDEPNGLVYLPVETPSIDEYGGNRPGDNLFAESLVAVDLHTGERKWYFQQIHHGLWDHDNSSAAMLVDITVDGQRIPAVALPTKQSYLYMFNRLTGKPVWPMPETPVPQSDVPGEVSSPTQPIPSKPAPYSRAFLTEDDIIDFTPQLHAQAMENLSHCRWLPTPYIPPVVPGVSKWDCAINIGNASGGVNWPGASLDPETQVAFIQANNASVSETTIQPVPPALGDAGYTIGGGCSGGPETGPYAQDKVMALPEAADCGAGGGRGGGILGRGLQGLPIVKPPYGVLTAIDLNTGEIKWQVPHGETPDNIRNNPALRGLDIPMTGQGGSLGLLVTKTLVVLGERQVTSPPGRERGAMLRAYDKETGENVGAVLMPGGQTGSPMTYMADGKQYIVVAIRSGSGSEYRAFTLPGNMASRGPQRGGNFGN